jgi:hypothetical protein
MIRKAFMRFKISLALTILTSFSVGCAAAQASTVKTSHNSSTFPSRVTGSVYCVHGTVTVKGWEQDLLKRNPGLRRFNWSPITAAKPGVMVFRQPGQSQTVKQYHYPKPRVLSYAEMRSAQRAQEKRTNELKAAQATAARINNADANGRLMASGSGREPKAHAWQKVQAQLVSTYTGATLEATASQPASYSSAFSASDNQRKVHGRLISSHL